MDTYNSNQTQRAVKPMSPAIHHAKHISEGKKRKKKKHEHITTASIHQKSQRTPYLVSVHQVLTLGVTPHDLHNTSQHMPHHRCDVRQTRIDAPGLGFFVYYGPSSVPF
jgi:hypothetical protein